MGKAMTRGSMVKDIATEHGLKTKQVNQVFESLAALGTKEVKKNGIFTVPGLCRIKTKTKKATKASKDSCEGFRSCCSQKSDLDDFAPRDLNLWESHRSNLGAKQLQAAGI